MHQVPLYINGEFTQSSSEQWIDVVNPANQEVLAKVPCATEQEVKAAIDSAQEAFKTWRNVPVPERARIMMKYAALLKEHQEEIATIICHELGKTFEDAKGDVWRGIEVVEQAANAPAMMMGETVENVARNIDTYSYTQPLGVCAGITPFNFPAMIPLWMFPMAIVCGNTFVLKPSEQDPLTPMRLVELFEEAGAPKGVLQVVHGTKDQVDQILEAPEIKAVSFVGSCNVGHYIYSKGTQHKKRVQACVGAKNHMVIMPDAPKAQTVNNLVGASVGAGGQRCMGISVAVFVGSSKEWVEDIKKGFEGVRPGLWNDPEAAYGPQTTPQAKQRILSLIQSGKDQGATCLVDGSDYTVEGYEAGNWVGPTLFTDVTEEMEIYKEEIFGPVLSCVFVDTLDEAIALINRNPYGNGTSLFTASGAAARKFQQQIEVGQVGINIPIPVPLPFFSFTGWKNSFYGDQHTYGKQGVRFYTETKTVTSRWFDDEVVTGPNMSINLR
ncbi:CoA-acylating methylmalonate-semialdehyde dehydrogenase [Pseudoalteromonas phenolica]|uniref:methylmalonate-semialdehyde dehydrogenase (CoA acylating) n=1 Tax=Pseudoalteromonas phenolica TaxID=161398 RepID=A0A0S2K298_9GAMM|nr:CoA-acylating methylmalonate-semialdehyde dehydrogenase [Pseudoalteromonas phenolica]ALO42190.1 Methylmalonate-semialdehyde dehydrogenase [Pseudoalteromonas phenolica]MBE0356716.1 malonate-semialdehyde dehydrogenase (acetylating) / methylmalonate-semialdehyde dehydrogenase [Pseudoalteromonas phenolica O-BC30]RXE94772.1 methylmalonate-semialdehyde dehydrogenase (CoA acylating) [Pseudoalteromonas phenolica O-BC30]TMO56675.1 methylmalonate-semialdehyde dehydrogenase (CoA acylating) [Pseudoalter